MESDFFRILASFVEKDSRYKICAFNYKEYVVKIS